MTLNISSLHSLLSTSSILDDNDSERILELFMSTPASQWDTFYPYIPDIQKRLVSIPSSGGSLSFSNLSGSQQLALLLSNSIEPVSIPMDMYIFRATYFAPSSPIYSHNVFDSFVNVDDNLFSEGLYMLRKAIRQAYVKTILTEDDEVNHIRLLERIQELDAVWIFYLCSNSSLPEEHWIMRNTFRTCMPRTLSANFTAVNGINPVNAEKIRNLRSFPTQLIDIVEDMQLLSVLYNTFNIDHALYCSLQNSYVQDGIGRVAMAIVSDRDTFPHALSISTTIPLLKSICKKSISGLEIDLSMMNMDDSLD